MRLSIAILFFILSIGFVHAGEIDSLKTKEEVQKFLAAKLRKDGLIWPAGHPDLSSAELYRMNYNKRIRSWSAFDTIGVVDPATDKTVLVAVPTDTTMNPYPRWHPPVVSISLPINNYAPNTLFDELGSYCGKTDTDSYRFYKADIDGDKHTDLVVCVGVGTTIVVMDRGDRCEGHLCCSSEYPFQNFLAMSDGTTALIFNHKSCWSSVTGKTEYNKPDTLAYKFHGFAKYNSHYKPEGIVKILYEYESHWGTVGDGSMNMEINKTGLCYLRYSQYDSTFSASVDAETFSDLSQHVVYADIRYRKGMYADTSSPSGSSSTISVYFEDGTMKKVIAWACNMPTGLDYVCKHISDISWALHWQPAKNPDSFKYQFSTEWPDQSEITGDENCDCIYYMW